MIPEQEHLLRLLKQKYLKTARPRERRRFRWYELHDSLSAAIKSAAFALCPNEKDEVKQHGHQRQGDETLSFAREALLAEKNKIANCRDDFHKLQKLVGERVQHIPNIGPVYVYDTATRIGAYLRTYPPSVYLHAGAREGARLLGFHSDQPYLLMDDLPTIFRGLEPYEVEDLLCWFAKEWSRRGSVAILSAAKKRGC